MLRKKRFIILFLVLMLFFNNQPTFSNDNYIPVRVGISNTNFSTYLFDVIEFNNANVLTIMDSTTGYNIPADSKNKSIKVVSDNNLFKIYIDNNLVAKNLTGPILIKPNENEVISITGLKRKGKQATYRGYIELTRSSKDISKFSIVNVLSLKNYLRGVVPNEMPVRFGLEALKAQTVAARNYAVTPRIKAYQEFDLCDSVACQVYFGSGTEDELSDKAIEETNGIIALDKEDNPILALYSSTAGGYTESYEYAFSNPETKEFPSNDIHYLRAVPDNTKFGLLDNDEAAEDFYTTPQDAYDDESPYFRWSKEWTKPEIEKVLSKTMVAQSKTGFITPALENSEQFGNLISIKTLKRGISGKIIQLEIKTDKETYTVSKELVIRRCFQKNGISLPSANFVINYIDSKTPVYKFIGGGFGHGVGLSQWGAGKMAKLGFTFDEILQHYYTGIKLATIPISVSGNGKTVERFFNVNKEKAKLYISNPDCIKCLYVKINSKLLKIKLKETTEIIDISRHIEKGKNRIEYLITDEDCDYTKAIKVHVIVKEAIDNG